jgi:hypothetical protein
MPFPNTARRHGMASVRRKASLLAACSLLLVAVAFEGFAAGYPLGLVLLAAATVQAAICTAMFRSPLLKLVLGASFVLFISHALAVAPFLRAEHAPQAALWADAFCAVLAAASLAFTPIQTMALVVREAYMGIRKAHPPR